MLPDGNTPRAVNAVRVLSQLQNATLDDVIKAAHDPYLPNAARFIPTPVSYTHLESKIGFMARIFSVDLLGIVSNSNAQIPDKQVKT